MSQHNLYSPNGRKLNYPHYTMWDIPNNTVCLVTNPKSKIIKGDIVFVAMETKNNKDEIVYSYFNYPHTVTNVIEERKAKGQHDTEFKPLFQIVAISRVNTKAS